MGSFLRWRRLLLEYLGYKTYAAQSGGEALAVFAQYRPRIVILDIKMPDMDGYEVAKRLRNFYGKKPVILALSGYEPESANGASLVSSSDFDDYLIKPVTVTMLENVLAKHSKPNKGSPMQA